MKFQVQFKNPDAVEYSVREAAHEEINRLHSELDQESHDDCVRSLTDEIYGIVSQWIKYHECITIEFDTDKNTAIVLKCQ